MGSISCGSEVSGNALTITNGDQPERLRPLAPNAKDDIEHDGAILSRLLERLRQHGIQAQDTNSSALPPEAQLHDRAAPVPALVASPANEGQVIQTIKSLREFYPNGEIPISIKSGGHGYFNGASCSGVMLDLGQMTRKRITGDVLFVEPGCVLGQVISTLANHRKAVPHGDCFGVGAGGHFLTAGWDLILGRRYGLGCQSVIGGRVVLWDGSVVDVDEETQPDLLHAMRGGALGGVGVATEVRLQLIEEPSLATWRFTPISKAQLMTCVLHKAFANASKLPRDISISFRFHFEPGQNEPVCSFNVVSLLTAKETIWHLNEHLGEAVTSIVGDHSLWSEKSLLDVRLLPASEYLAAHPERLADMSSLELSENPLTYWKETVSLREMARSYFTSISHWVQLGCDEMLHALYEAFESAQSLPARQRMYALVTLGGGRMLDLQDRCSMPLGQALARFELHWDDPEKEERWSRQFTARISSIIRGHEDLSPGRPYRGDIWLPEQAENRELDTRLLKFSRWNSASVQLR